MRLRKWYRVGAPLIALGLLLWGAPAIWHQLTGKPWDGMQEWWCARLWWDGQDPYSKAGIARINIGYIGHPPTTSFYALPLALFPLAWMGRILGAIVMGLLLTQLYLTARELRWFAPLQTAALLFALILSTAFMRYHLGVAQVSELIGFLYFLAWYFWRRDREVAAGLALGFACTLKLYPGLLVFLLLLSRRWRGVLAAGAVWISVAAIMTARFGLVCWREYFSTEKYVVDMWIGHASNVTIQGLVLRMLHPACVSDSPSDPRATHIAAAIALVLVAGFVWLSRDALRRADRIDLPYALFVVLSMFANAFYWEHYHVILALPLAVAGTALWYAWRAGLPRVWAVTGALALAAAIACCLVPPNKARILLYLARKTPELHFAAHLNEVLVALPMPLILTVLASLLLWFSRRGFAGLEELGRVRATRTS